MDGDSIRPTYVRVKDNVARIVSRDTMITFSRLYIRERVADSYIRNQVYDAFIGSVLSKPESAYSMLRVKEVNFMTDAQDTIYFCFRNKIIAVSRDVISEIDYVDAPGVMWEDQIIDFESRDRLHKFLRI